jgi:hypothetical protein
LLRQRTSSALTPTLLFIADSSAAVLSVMAVSGYRHVPVLDLDGSIKGIASPQRATEFLQKYFEPDA